MLAIAERISKQTGIAMRDEIEELLEDWYAWQSEYQPKLGYGRADPTCRGYQPRRRSSEDLADLADERARRLTCEAVDACVSRLDLRARMAIQTEMRNRRSGAQVWHSIRLAGDLANEYARAIGMLEPMLFSARLIERACKP